MNSLGKEATAPCCPIRTIDPCTYCSRYFVPGLFQSIDGRIREGGTDLQHPVKVVQAAANVRHGCPLLDGRYPRCHVAPEGGGKGETMVRNKSLPRLPTKPTYLDTISEQTNREPSLKRFVIRMICSARDFLSDFIQA